MCKKDRVCDHNFFFFLIKHVNFKKEILYLVMMMSYDELFLNITSLCNHLQQSYLVLFNNPFFIKQTLLLKMLSNYTPTS